jgi:Na+/H+-translocating membrane pyrophosphatase
MVLYFNAAGFLVLFVEFLILCVLAIVSAIALYRAWSNGNRLINPFILSLFATVLISWWFISLSTVPDELNVMTALVTFFLLASITGVIIVKLKKENKMLLGFGYFLCWTTILTVILSSVILVGMS